MPHQHNGVDCGLYMLKYIEKLASDQTDLAAVAGKRKRERDPVRWTDHPRLAFNMEEIDVFRMQLVHDINEASKAQKEEREERERQREPKRAKAELA